MTRMIVSNTLKSGELDPAFGADGKVEIPGGIGSVRSIITDGQSGFYTAVYRSGMCWIYHFFVDGAQDFQFGEGGVAKWSFSTWPDSRPIHLALQPGGKILLLGKAGNNQFEGNLALTRFNSTGSPDLVFGTKISPFREDFSPSIAVQADGKILLLVDRFGQDGLPEQTLLQRLLPGGDPDPGFGDQGSIVIRFSDQVSRGRSLAVMDDGKILVAGDARREDSDPILTHAVGRYSSDGQLDQSFGKSGYWETDGLNSTVATIALDLSGIICAGTAMGSAGHVIRVSKLTHDGRTDPMFNNGESVFVEIPADRPGYFVWCNEVAVDSNGRILVGGYAGANTKAFWLRLLPDGSRDFDYRDQGVVVIDQLNNLYGLILSPNQERVLVAVDARESKPYVYGVLN
ncbi:hypothetical protein [Pseudomonas pharyngis]|uniref:hypothetical protein n=1 Tax=Pseudomonas pharyngis TaxID=2892333 RepID=UPI001F421A36|nr:hypothetical protein [Pseudomonas pharyngis]